MTWHLRANSRTVLQCDTVVVLYEWNGHRLQAQHNAPNKQQTKTQNICTQMTRGTPSSIVYYYWNNLLSRNSTMMMKSLVRVAPLLLLLQAFAASAGKKSETRDTL